MTPHAIRRGSVFRDLLRLVPLAGLVVLVAGTANAATVSVAAVNFAFEPDARTVDVGDVVRWTFAGDPHTVTSGTPGAPDGTFDSGIKDAGATYQVTFDTPGTYRYFCQIHPEQMVGTIVVRATETTPKPTTKPTARPTAKPTAKPTARPTARPTATATPRPTVAPTASPTARATATLSPAPTATASETVQPTSSPSPSSSSEAPSASPASTPAPGAAGGSSGGLDPVLLVGGAALFGVVIAGALGLRRRARAA
jgi:plastocyanin